MGSEKTEVVYGTSNVLNTEIQFFSNARHKVDSCMDYTHSSLVLRIESIRKSFLDAKDRDVKLRYITEITTENIPYCKELMKISEVRHLDGIRNNFMVSEKEYLAPAVSNNATDIASQIIYSNLPDIVSQQNYIFDTLWNKAIPAIQQIRGIEEGLEPIATRLLENPDETIKSSAMICQSVCILVEMKIKTNLSEDVSKSLVILHFIIILLRCPLGTYVTKGGVRIRLLQMQIVFSLGGRLKIIHQIYSYA